MLRVTDDFRQAGRARSLREATALDDAGEEGKIVVVQIVLLV